MVKCDSEANIFHSASQVLYHVFSSSLCLVIHVQTCPQEEQINAQGNSQKTSLFCAVHPVTQYGFRASILRLLQPSGKLGCSVEISPQREISILSSCLILIMLIFTGQINGVAHLSPQSIFTGHRDSTFIPFYLTGSQQCQSTKAFSFCGDKLSDCPDSTSLDAQNELRCISIKFCIH